MAEAGEKMNHEENKTGEEEPEEEYKEEIEEKVEKGESVNELIDAYNAIVKKWSKIY